ncbi:MULTISPECIES: hypothetical protein [unclassified Rickettsia]
MLKQVQHDIKNLSHATKPVRRMGVNLRSKNVSRHCAESRGTLQ